MLVSAIARRLRPAAPLLPAILACLAALLGGAAPALAHAGRRTVRYDGVRFTVPAGWPVFDLTRRPRTCVRFDRHAVYLGRPSSAESCPANAVGRTEAVLVSPTGATSGSDRVPSMLASPRARARAAAPTAGSIASVRRGRARVTATWRTDPAAVQSALGDRAPTALATRLGSTGLLGPAAQARPRATAPPTTFPTGAPAATGSPGAIYTGEGFDTCAAPSANALAAWLSSPFRAVGVYIGGTNMACAQPNLTPAWVTGESAAGWHLIPIYVGLQAPTSGCGCATISAAEAAVEGTAAAQDAIAEAQALGLGTGNPIYDDMENYTRGSSASAAVLAFLGAWTVELHASGYASGIYSSELSGIEDLVGQFGTTFPEPDDIWVADWNGQATTAAPALPSTAWIDHQRLHQYRGGHVDDYGGTSIDIDTDYVDAATAAPGVGSVTTTIAAAPTVTVRPQANGTLEITPRWSGQPGIDRFRILAGGAPGSLATIASVQASTRPPVVLRSSYPDFQVEAISDADAVLGSSGVTPVADHVAIYGNSSFVPTRGPGGVPVKCFGIAGCRVATTVWAGRRRIAQTGLERIPAGGGIVHFALSTAWHRRVRLAPGGRLPVTVVVRTSGGPTAGRTISLVPFAVAGRAPRTRHGGSGELRILGVSDFVSHGWSGGVLVACVAAAPCSATMLVTADGGTVVADADPQTLGAGQVGYLAFRMTAAGHALLRSIRSNQLGARITVTTEALPSSSVSPEGLTTTAPPSERAQALVALSAF